ncbi:MAG TPA: ABC transporter, partial [archaeon]|nr:ABC transporter [archaeon]
KTILLTTHYMAEAEQLCDRIALIRGGKIIAFGKISELRKLAGKPKANLEEIFLHLTKEKWVEEDE